VSPAEQTRPPFYEHRAFKGTAAIVALATALVALVGPLGKAVDGLSSDPPERIAWTQVVLNTSSAMGERFGDGDETALESAVAGVAKAVKELDNNGVGLRATSSSCEKESRGLVNLADGDADEVIREAREQRATGDASIVDAILGGLDEFNGEPMRDHGAKSKRMYVFTTDTPSCPWDDPTGEVRQRLEEIEPKRVGPVEVFALESDGEGTLASSATGESRMVSLATVAENGAELNALETLLGPRAEIHLVATPTELYEEAERAGEEAREAVEQIEEGEAGETGTSDEGGQQ
jgi:hypothetical protein